MIVLNRWSRIVAGLLLTASAARADDFQRLEGEALGGVPGSAVAHEVMALGQDEMARLPRIFPGVRSTVLVARTDEGNLSRLLVSIARRRGGENEAPVLILERFATFAAGGFRQRQAQGRELMLFDGGRIDLDSGQMVPEGYGGDLRVVVDGAGALSLRAEPGAVLYTLKASPLEAKAAAGRPSPGRAVLPADHAGRYRLIIGGRWSGELELRVEGDGQVSGSFRSDQTGAVYRVHGEVVRGGNPRLEASIDFPRSRMTLSGHLWPDGKDAMAGDARLMEQEYGFVAVREGCSAEPPEILDAAPTGADGLTLRLAADGTLRRGDVVVEPAALAAEAEAGAPVRVEAGPDVPIGVVSRTMRLLREAGFDDVRIGGSTDE